MSHTAWGRGSPPWVHCQDWVPTTSREFLSRPIVATHPFAPGAAGGSPATHESVAVSVGVWGAMGTSMLAGAALAAGAAPAVAGPVPSAERPVAAVVAVPTGPAAAPWAAGAALGPPPEMLALCAILTRLSIR